MSVERSSHGRALDAIQGSIVFSDVTAMFLYLKKDVLNVCGAPCHYVARQLK